MRPIVFALAALGLSWFPYASRAEVSPEIHKLCLEAKDYPGCVRAQRGDLGQHQTVRNVQGETELTGNSCPDKFAYSGSGYCREVICVWGDGNEKDLGNKGFTCPRGLLGGMSLRWGDAIVKAVADPKCPSKEPGIGWSNSCDEAKIKRL